MADTADHSDPYNPRILRVKNDEDSVTLYQAFPSDIADPAVLNQSLLAAPGFSTSRMTWFKTSFTQAMYVTNYGQRDVRRSCILAFRVTYCGLEDILSQAALSYSSDVTTSGEVDISAPVHVIWDATRTSAGNKSRRKKSMHIGVSGDLLVQLVSKEILEIEDVTTKAFQLADLVMKGDQAGAERFVEELGEEELPLENEDIEWRLGML